MTGYDTSWKADAQLMNNRSTNDVATSIGEPPRRVDIDVWQLPRGVHKVDATTIADSQRGRIVFGLVQSVAEKGYVATTVADVCGLAKVSKSTFYKLFGDKESAFLAAYEVAHRELADRVVREQDFDADWNSRMRASLSAYLDYNHQNPAVARTFLVEIHSVGAAAWELRDWGHDRFARMQQGLYRLRRHERPKLPDLPHEVFRAVVAALEEMVSNYVRQDRATELLELLPRAMFLTEAIYGAGPGALSELLGSSDH